MQHDIQLRSILSVNARRAITACLNAFDEPEQDFSSLHEFTETVLSLGNECSLVLSEIIRVGGKSSAFFASATFFVMSKRFASSAANIELTRIAENHIVCALSEESDINILSDYCRMLGLLKCVPEGAVTVLGALLENENDFIRIYAASALCHAEQGSRSFNILRLALMDDTGEPFLRFAAASTLIGIGFQLEDCVQCIATIFDKLPTTFQLSALHIIEGLGDVALPLIRILEKSFYNTFMSNYCRGRIAAAIGSITRSKVRHAKMLFTLLDSGDPNLVEGAIDGLLYNNRMDSKVFKKVKKLLLSDNEKLRIVAAKGIGKYGPRAGSFTPLLLERLRVEPNSDCCVAIAMALGKIGKATLEPMINIIVERDMRSLPFLVMSFRTIGEESAVALAEVLLVHPDIVVCSIALYVLKELGGMAHPALPVIADIIERADDEDIAYPALCVMYHCEVKSQEYALVLARCLLKWSGDGAQVAIKCLQNMGDIGIQALNDVSVISTGEAKMRITNVIRLCYRQTDKSYEELERINQDDNLRLFVVIAKEFISTGANSWTNIGILISRKINFRKVNGSEFGLSGKSLADVVIQLSDALPDYKPLTTHAPKKRGKLTPKGEALLEKAKSYLLQKYGS